MSTNPTPQAATVTVEDVRTYGPDLIVSLSNGTEARHPFPSAMICGEVHDVDQGGNWQIGDDEKVIDLTTDDLLDYVPSLAELFYNLGYLGRYTFGYMDPSRLSWETWSRTHYVFAASWKEARQMFDQHNPGATKVYPYSVSRIKEA